MNAPAVLNRAWRSGVLGAIALLLCPAGAGASDHADPVDLPMPWELLNDGKPKPDEVRRLTAGITDLFIFPTDENGRVLSFPRGDESRASYSPEERAKLAQLPVAERAKLLALPRKERSVWLASMNTTGPVLPLSREELDKLERTTPQEKSALLRLTPEERGQFRALAFILCVRRAYEDSPLELAPYTYSIHLDHHTTVAYEAPEGTTPEETARIHSERARYGGRIGDSMTIRPDITLQFRLNNDATLKSFDIVGLANDAAKQRVRVFPTSEQSGIRDDPFIFPPFFRTNVVAMAALVPLEAFPPDKRAWIAWADSRRDGKKVDHGGRSLRTQQPRFTLLNSYEPKDQVAALQREQRSPMLMRDILVRFGIPTLFNYRPWDSVPDVMIYNTDYDVRFPNGRLLTDDVARLLAENGDALLHEISYEGMTWPRATENDKPFLADFPYLAEPWKQGEFTPRSAPELATKNKFILLIVVAVAVAVLFGAGWLLATYRCRKMWRQRYL